MKMHRKSCVKALRDLVSFPAVRRRIKLPLHPGVPEQSEVEEHYPKDAKSNSLNYSNLMNFAFCFFVLQICTLIYNFFKFNFLNYEIYKYAC